MLSEKAWHALVVVVVEGHGYWHCKNITRILFSGLWAHPKKYSSATDSDHRVHGRNPIRPSNSSSKGPDKSLTRHTSKQNTSVHKIKRNKSLTIKKNLSQQWPAAWVLVDYRCSQVNNQKKLGGGGTLDNCQQLH